MVKREANFRQFNSRQKDTIEKFLDEVLKLVRNAQEKLKEIPKRDRPLIVVNNLRYWKHAEGALKFAHGQNKPVKRKQRNGKGGNDKASSGTASSRSSNEDSTIPQSDSEQDRHLGSHDEAVSDVAT